MSGDAYNKSNEDKTSTNCFASNSFGYWDSAILGVFLCCDEPETLWKVKVGTCECPGRVFVVGGSWRGGGEEIGGEALDQLFLST